MLLIPARAAGGGRPGVGRAASLLVFSLVIASPSAGAAARTLRLDVDASDAPRHLLRARLTVPASPGPLTLVYPKWIPGEHGPTGPVSNLSGLTITAAGRGLEWRRDAREPYSFHCEVPAGAREIQVALEQIIPFEAGGRHMVRATPHLAWLEWNEVLLYPERPGAESLAVEARLRLPEGWKWGSALPATRSSGDRVAFRPVPLVTLVDSPVLMGEHFRSIPLAPEAETRHVLQIAGDSPEAIEIDSATVASYGRLVREARALLGPPPYRRYHFLLAVTDGIPYGGLEHHESSINRFPERTFSSPSLRLRAATLLPHELAHSWNGKYRRPAGLVTRPFLEPMETELLWVYEGLTDFLAWVLATRSGLLSPDQARSDLAEIAAYLDHQVGRSWRPLADAAVSAHTLFGTGQAGAMRRRSFADVYNEAVLLWLEVDAILRNRSAGRRSIEDFCERFFAGARGEPAIRPYTLDDVVAILNDLAPYDWRPFFDERVTAPSRRAPLNGIVEHGWKLAYADTLSPYARAIEEARERTNLLYSIGVTADRSGKVLDVVPGMPAARAGIDPGMHLAAVNGRKWSPEVIRAALRAGRASGTPLEILTESAGEYRPRRVDHRGGNRHPVLVRDASKKDGLEALLSPRVGPRRPRT